MANWTPKSGTPVEWQPSSGNPITQTQPSQDIIPQIFKSMVSGFQNPSDIVSGVAPLKSSGMVLKDILSRVGQKVVTPLISEEQVKQSPAMMMAGRSLPTTTLMGGPFLSSMVPPIMREQMAPKQFSEQTSPLQILSTLGILGRGASPIIKEASTGIRSNLANRLLQSAEKGYKQAIGPTTQVERTLSEKVIPEITKRRIFAFSKQGLLNKVANENQIANENLNIAFESIPENQKIKIKPIIDKVSAYQEELKINGILPEENIPLDNFLTKSKENLLKVTQNTDVSPSTIREYRQVLDRAIEQSKKGFTMTGRGGLKLKAQRAMANTIRNELAQQFPSIGKLNNEVSLWINTQKLLESTLNKVARPTIDIIAGIGNVGEVMGGRGIGIVLRNLGKVISSNVALKTFSSSTKSRLAELISKGYYKSANNLLISSIK